MGGDPFLQTRLLNAPSSLALNTAREGAATPSLGNLCQCLTTLRVKDFFLTSNLNPLSFSLKPLPLVLSLHDLVKSPSPAFSQPAFSYWMAAVRPPRSLLSSRLTSPSSRSLSSQEECSSARTVASITALKSSQSPQRRAKGRSQSHAGQ